MLCPSSLPTFSSENAQAHGSKFWRTATLILSTILLIFPAAARAQRPIAASTTVTSQGGTLQATTTTTALTGAAYNPSRMFVKFRAGRRDFLPGSANARAMGHNPNVFLVDTPPGLSVAEAVAQYKRNPNVEYAEPDYVVNIVATPGDHLWASQWDMVKIAAPQMWDTQTDSSGVYVAVIDTGIDQGHPDLSANVVPGWNCSGAANINPGTGQPYGCTSGLTTDDHGHGTHVAGTIGAKGQLASGEGIAGINWTAKIMGFKFLNSGGSGNVSDAVYAFNKILELKNAGTNFRITNNSWGGGGFTQTLKDAMAAVEAAGVVNVCAAGNSGANADFAPMYPAAYDNRGIISVLATDSSDIGAGFTNYGEASVDIAAPGVSTLSTSPTGTCSLCGTPVAPDLGAYRSLSGTSMASPHVAGAVAALIQRNMNLNGGTSNLNAFQIRDMILDPASYDVMSDAKALRTSTGGRLNLAKMFFGPNLASPNLNKLKNPPAQLNQFPSITMGANIFAAGNQQVTVSASGSDPDPADNNLRFGFGKSGASNWLFGSMLYSLFPIPPAGVNSYTFPTPFVGRTAVETYMGSVTDNRGGGASGAQYVTVSPVAGPTAPPDGTFSLCETGKPNCAGSGGIINVTRTINCGTNCLAADITVNYSPIDPDGKGTPLWDSWYSTNGGAGGSCCYNGSSTPWRITSAGAFRFSVNSVDRYLETSPTTTAGRKTAIVRVDGATGTPPLAQLSADVVSGPAPLTVNFSMAGTQAFDGKSIQYYFMGCGEGIMYGQSVGTRQCVFTTPGTYWVENLVADTAGMDDVVNMYIVVTPPNGGGGGDTTGPTVSMTAPAAGNVKGTITVSANASDNVGGSGMKEVKFYRDSAVLLNTITGAGPYSFSWDSASAGDGAHTLYAVATDNANNPTTSGNVSITVDNTAPTPSFTAPASGATVSGAGVTVSGTANDNAGGSGMANLTVRLDNAVSGSIIGQNSGGAFSFTWNTTSGVSNGAHTLYAIATDVLGNSATVGRPVTVNNALAPLTISLSVAPLPVAKKANETITAAVSTDPSASITKVDFYINGTLVGTDSTGPTYTQLWKVPAAPGRSYNLSATVTDSLGRTAVATLPTINP